MERFTRWMHGYRVSNARAQGMKEVPHLKFFKTRKRFAPLLAPAAPVTRAQTAVLLANYLA
ncbi:hypothetical protein [Oscillibacter sp.]|uniref:hypothetical protein n=1 Tax=Oscillibacter sp. TaxID=1945593 RepID=UPI00261B425C|nr:hypothetical protein [Oscillibacter sp.]MDD3347785.1 hypothetical protein [Oscillibacter sp.]